MIFAGLAVIYTLFLIYAAGMKFLVLSAILYGPGTAPLFLGAGRAEQNSSSHRSSGSFSLPP